MRKIVLGVIGLLIIIGAFFISKILIESKNRKKPIPPKVVKTVYVKTIKNGSVPIIIPAQGNLIAKRRIELFSEVQGIFETGDILFRTGQTYKKGDTLIKVNSDEFKASVQVEKSNLYNSIASIMPDLRLDFPKIYNKWQSYLNGFDLTKETPKLPKMTSEKENFFITGRGIVSSYYRVKNLEQRFAKYSIVAPFTGVLTEAVVTEGTLIRNGQRLGQFIEPTVYEMQISISKTYANLLKIGKNVELTNLEKTKTYTGKVTRVNGSVDVSSQTVQIFVEVLNKNLKEGMFLQANIAAKNEENAVEIDRSLLTEDKKIFIVKDTILDVMDVYPVYFSDEKVILKNIPNGTQILSKPVPGAYAGMAVKPILNSK